MRELPALPSYAELTSLLSTIESADASEIHGLLCGLISATDSDANTSWQTALFPDKKRKSKKLQTALEQLYEASYHELSEFSFEFSLVLPDDDAALNHRAESLGRWCQGFLTGLKRGDITAKKEGLPAEISETLNDIGEIALVNFDGVTTNDEDETAYYELVEYVRLAVLTIYHELKPKRPEPTITSENDLLH